jgi:hypothetical protein
MEQLARVRHVKTDLTDDEWSKIKILAAIMQTTIAELVSTTLRDRIKELPDA